MGDQDLSQTLGDLLEIKGKYMNSSSRNLLWKKVMEAQAKRSTWLGSLNQKLITNIQAIKASGGGRGQQHHSNLAIMKTRRNPTRNNALKMIKRRRLRRVGQEGSRRATTMAIERKVRTLKKLIPKGESTIGLDGLFRETAEYISNLQMRVRIMQAVVDALSNSE
ncbi:transcription factor UPBEAT1 [Cynara cardunculus var. scolymus]|uniref:Myc-type, basic helix-loop-helix (BHLH) domain-containing protein n=1 Tax=Cynara cardunculus var. scolymus TaxID=59895 RepID=A0A124SCQ5_CYNCS|nr:transcription factor UPBEAT1 [Cynara cardunculus var. scolymus]KVH94526.1 hypothetical protein Ccrd_003430 [Cynara cardunculus var. scolymus]